MHNKIKKYQISNIKYQKYGLFLIFIFYFLFFIFCFAEGGGPGTTSANFLKIGIGARPVGMGEAFVAVADDANTIVHNPAGLAKIKNKEFSAMHLEYFQNIRYEAFSYVHPLPEKIGGTAGLSLGYLYMNDLKRTLYYEEEVYYENGEFGACDRTVVLGFGRNIDRKTSAGFNCRFLRETLDDVSAAAFALDLGLLREFSRKITVGFAVQNIGTRIKFIEVNETIPVVFKSGVSSAFFKNKLKLAVEIYKPVDNHPELKFGSELWIFNLLAPRIGYRYRTWSTGNNLGSLSGLTAGLGIKVYNYTVDYAFVPYGDLGYTHRFSLGGKF